MFPGFTGWSCAQLSGSSCTTGRWSPTRVWQEIQETQKHFAELRVCTKSFNTGTIPTAWTQWNPWKQCSVLFGCIACIYIFLETLTIGLFHWLPDRHCKRWEGNFNTAWFLFAPILHFCRNWWDPYAGSKKRADSTETHKQSFIHQYWHWPLGQAKHKNYKSAMTMLPQCAQIRHLAQQHSLTSLKGVPRLSGQLFQLHNCWVNHHVTTQKHFAEQSILEWCGHGEKPLSAWMQRKKGGLFRCDACIFTKPWDSPAQATNRVLF